MKLFRVFLSLVLAFSALHAVGSSSDDDVLLLTQISGTNYSCCITPLLSQKDGAADGPSAEWVKAKFELTDGAKTVECFPIPWQIGYCTKVVGIDLESNWNCLKVLPTIGERTRKILGMSVGETIYFAIGVTIADHQLTIDNAATMVRVLGRKVTRKKMSILSQAISSADGRKKGFLKIANE